MPDKDEKKAAPVQAAPKTANAKHDDESHDKHDRERAKNLSSNLIKKMAATRRAASTASFDSMDKALAYFTQQAWSAAKDLNNQAGLIEAHSGDTEPLFEVESIVASLEDSARATAFVISSADPEKVTSKVAVQHALSAWASCQGEMTEAIAAYHKAHERDGRGADLDTPMKTIQHYMNSLPTLLSRDLTGMDGNVEGEKAQDPHHNLEALAKDSFQSDLDSASAALKSVLADNVADATKVDATARHLDVVARDTKPYKAVLTELANDTKRVITKYPYLAKDLATAQKVFDRLASGAGR